MLKCIFLTVLALSLPIGAVSQTTQPLCSAAINAGSQFPAVTRTGVGTPYSLTATIKTEMKLSDGNTIGGFMTSHQARDSQGRTRVDNPSYCALDKDHQPHLEGVVILNDPIAKTRTFWNEGLSTVTKIATVTHIPSLTISNPPTMQQEYRMAQQMSQAYDQASPQAKQYSDEYKVEDLGKRDIAGLEASGMRITRMSPVGVVGNSLPLIYVEERWESDQYGIYLLDIIDNPVLGKTAYEVTNFSLGEPDASLFQPPADYTINQRNAAQ